MMKAARIDITLDRDVSRGNRLSHASLPLLLLRLLP
jgi:hypothetical protein